MLLLSAPLFLSQLSCLIFLFIYLCQILFFILCLLQHFQLFIFHELSFWVDGLELKALLISKQIISLLIKLRVLFAYRLSNVQSGINFFSFLKALHISILTIISVQLIASSLEASSLQHSFGHQAVLLWVTLLILKSDIIFLFCLNRSSSWYFALTANHIWFKNLLLF